MISKEDIQPVLDKMIISASGWRGVFAADGADEGITGKISSVHSIIIGAAALIFAEYLQKSKKNTTILVGFDTRPTGPAIAASIIPVLLSSGCNVRYAGIIAAPEIMAWARSKNEPEVGCGFIYVSASHNPIGHNGLKFGLTDGGVLSAEEAAVLIDNFRLFLGGHGSIAKIETLLSAADPAVLEKVYSGEREAKEEALKAYYDFCSYVAWNAKNDVSIASKVKSSLEKQPLGIVCDFNGSARTVSIDNPFFASLGLKFNSINDTPGEIAHRIVPEGESLEPCRLLLEKAHNQPDVTAGNPDNNHQSGDSPLDASFLLGYVPDCDGDRGNLVIWDDKQEKARALEAQEVFALACIAEFSHLVWTGDLKCGNGTGVPKTAVAVNDPTSLRIDRIAEAFGISVFRAEVGEANVVGLARRLRQQGYIVRILGEGSAGGNITHPSAVRDPINTILAIVKLLSVRSGSSMGGLFEIWCKLSGQMQKSRETQPRQNPALGGFTLADILASLPPFTTTGAYCEDAILRINTKDHGLLKNRYQKIFTREWEERKDDLKTRYGICNWEAIAYNGMEERRRLSNFGDSGKGGLKILFYNAEGRAFAAIWMRGSATEPVFRIMADAEGTESQLERDLLNWQRQMIMEADGCE